jgi:Xaa-Pro aminopeptidase
MESKSIWSDRLDKLKEIVARRKLKAVFISNTKNCTYLSGFTGDDSFLLIAGEKNIFITDSRYTEQAAAQAPDFEILGYKGAMLDALAEELRKSKIRVLGFEDTYTVFSMYGNMKKKLRVRLEPLGEELLKLRSVKDAHELEIIKKAAMIADSAFEHILGFIKPGISEMDVAAEIEYSMKKNGAEKCAFDTVVASGERSSMPHGVASERILKSGDTITMDYGAVVSGYCSDITRTVFLGKPNEEVREIYNIVLDAQKKGIEGAREGLRGREIDSVARGYIKEKGFDEYFGHGLGHGIGLEIHEEPRLSPKSETIMRNGMVVTVEPGIYIPGKYGVRIEDDIVINGQEPIILTKAPKNPIML